ncbi:MAG: hypothetical protein R6U86_06310 [Bacteroidales bacterium]
MKTCVFIWCLICLVATEGAAQLGQVLSFRGQASAWANVNPGNDMPLWMGARYLPQANLDLDLGEGRLAGFEVSANLNGSGGLRFFDSLSVEGRMKPYRVWARYATNQLELRIGLQKINFGSASMLRPLMWFDQVDPRDPLQLTDGVWGLLGRYYFLNNANIWVWALYGNEGPKTWETGPTTNKKPEYGGRFQMPVARGEAAISFHHRKADQHFESVLMPHASCLPVFMTNIPENRYGFDAKWDVEVGLWVEATWINKRQEAGPFTNMQLFNLGADYTFGIGNGLHLVAEHLLFSLDQKAFAFERKTNFTATSVSYPIGILDHISGIFYYDWTNGNLYSFANWHRQFNRVSFYLMAFWNPETFQLPQQSADTRLFSGKGFQIMLVYNH